MSVSPKIFSWILLVAIPYWGATAYYFLFHHEKFDQSTFWSSSFFALMGLIVFLVWMRAYVWFRESVQLSRLEKTIMAFGIVSIFCWLTLLLLELIQKPVRFWARNLRGLSTAIEFTFLWTGKLEEKRNHVMDAEWKLWMNKFKCVYLESFNADLLTEARYCVLVGENKKAANLLDALDNIPRHLASWTLSSESEISMQLKTFRKQHPNHPTDFMTILCERRKLVPDGRSG